MVNRASTDYGTACFGTDCNVTGARNCFENFPELAEEDMAQVLAYASTQLRDRTAEFMELAGHISAVCIRVIQELRVKSFRQRAFLAAGGHG